MQGEGPRILGIVNVTEDSFSDGGRYLAPEKAVAHCHRLVEDGAFAVDLGPASSHPDAKAVSAAEEIGRLEPILAALAGSDVRISIDSWQPETQRWALAQGIAFLNDIRGFPDAALHPLLAGGNARLIVMHSMQGREKADRRETDPETIVPSIEAFFEQRIAALERGGVARERLILDPGMGFFLGSNPEPSLVVLREICRFKKRFCLPMLVSVSRKSFLRALTLRESSELGPASLAAEIFAANEGVDYIRTHDVAALRDALRVQGAL